MLYLCRVKPLRHYLRGFLIAAWAGDKIAEFSFPEISFHFSLRPWFFFVSPAYAGKSHSYLNSTFLNLGSPPRMRGKVTLQDVPCDSVGITPPHVRRKVSKRFFLGAAYRITPACAGKSSEHMRKFGTNGDHPRVCGEKLFCRQFRTFFFGITPACAGKRCFVRFVLLVLEDHPRMCGEKLRQM